ncbi:MAG: Gfo/Idh/MocA family oxidoreductase [Verrucomicrobiota bacterium]
MKAVIIGACGANARHHIRAYKALNVEIAAIVDVNENGKKLAAEIGAEFFTDFRSINSSICDVASVSLPPYLHPLVTTQLLKNQVHVLCEKPISCTVKDGKPLRAVLASSKAKLMVGFSMRFDQRFIALRKLVQSGVFGDVLYINARYSAASSFAGLWRADPEKGGGIFLVNSIHFMDLIPWMIGKNVVSVDAYGGSAFQKEKAEDNGVICLKHQGGCLTMASGHYWPFKESEVVFEVIGTKARALLEKDAVVLHKAGSEKERIPCGGNMIEEEIKYFIDCIRTGSPPCPSLDESLKATHLIECAKNSVLKEQRIWIQN